MKQTLVATALALLSGCAAHSGPDNAATGGTTAVDVPLYQQNPANTERAFSLRR